MTERPALFLDDGGVISDNERRGPQWQEAVAAFFAPRLGGDPARWAAANRAVMDAILAPGAWEARLTAAGSYAAFEQAYQHDWLAGMCSQVGVPLPPPDEAYALARQAAATITRRVRAAFSGAVAAIRCLHAGGHVLHTASGEPSWDLAGYLGAEGVAGLFGRLYGPDLVDTFKAGPAYYAHIFADAGVAPGDAIVVDDSPAAVAWAAAAGARTVLVGPGPPGAAAPTWRIGRLADLPALLETRPG